MNVPASSLVSKEAVLGKNVKIAPHVCIGSGTEIGDDSIIQFGAFIEHDCRIGKRTRVGTNAVLRRGTVIGDNSVFGSLSASEGYNWIGNNVLIHTQCHVTVGAVFEDYSFVAPLFVEANDIIMLYKRENIQPFVPDAPYIKFGARIGVGVTLLPGVSVGREAVIGAGATIVKDIPDFAVVVGVPGRVIGSVEEKWRLPNDLFTDFRTRVSEEALHVFLNNVRRKYEQEHGQKR